MQSILNKIINVEYFVPERLIPKTGNNKNIQARKLQNHIILKCDRCRKAYLPKYIIMEPKDLVAVGLYYAEGDKYINLDKEYHHSGEVAFVNTEVSCVMLIIQLLEKFGISRRLLKWRIDLNIKHYLDKDKVSSFWIKEVGIAKENRRPKWIYRTGKSLTQRRIKSSKFGCIHIYYSSVIFRNFFLHFIDSVFEYCIKNKLKEELALILKGFFAGDGSVNYCREYNRKQVDFCNNDLILLNKIRKSLEILGLRSIKETWPERTKISSKSLRIYNLHDFRILKRFEILDLVEYKKETFSNILSSY